MTKSFRILILEDNPVDAELVQYELQEAGFAFTAKVVMTEKDFVHELQEYCPDLILSDYDLPQYNGALALAEARRRCPDIPFILVTGAVGEERAIEILTQGAKDYVLKSVLQRLAPAVQRALAEAEEHRARKAAEEELLESHSILESMVEERSAALRESGDRYRSLFENMLNGFAYCRMLFDQERPQDFIYLDVNSAFESLTGLKNVVGKKISDVIPGLRESDPELFEIYSRVALTGKPEKFEKYVEALKMWFSISVFSPEKEHFVALFDVITERKQVEEERYQSERHYRLLHETMLQGVVYQDAEGKVISMNPAAVRILGKGPEESPGHTAESVEHHTLRGDGSFLPALDHPSMVALRTGQELRDVVMGVYNPREKDYRWINVRAMPLFRPGEGKPHQVYIIFDDITERRRIETTLQDSEVCYRRLFEAAQDGILIIDAKTGQIVDVNPFLMDMLNYSKDDFTGKKLWEIGAFKDTEKSKIAFAELQNNQYIRYEDLQLETKNGRLIDVEFVSNVYLVDHTKVIQCNIRDITQRKLAERRQLLWVELMGIVNESHSLVNTINSILTSIKREMGFEAVGIRLRSGNDFPYFVQNGFSPDFLLTENTLTVRDQDGGVCRDKNGNISLECTCGLVISGQTDPTSHLFTPGGSFWTNDSLPLLELLPDQDPRLHPRNRCIHEGFHSVALIPIRANQETVGLLQLNGREKGCFTLDMITFFEGLGLSIGIALSRQQAEEAIKERTSQLEAANKELESFSYSISHDLRAPLRAINGFSRMLARDLKDKLDEESMHRLDTIRKNGLKMNQLIDDVLTFSRLSNESLTMTVISMEDLATDVWKEIQENNPQRNISVNVAHPMACYGDHKMMRRVLSNLLSNAIKFTKERQTAMVEVGSYEKEHEYVYYVKDNGSGFDMQYSAKLFQLFQRLHSDADFEGTGAGLSIVKRIVERHCGRVWAEGKVDEGATFYFTLPKSLPVPPSPSHKVSILT